MSLPDEVAPCNNLGSMVGDYYAPDLGTPSALLPQEWLFADLETSPTSPLPIYTPPLGASGKGFDFLGGQVNNPLGTMLPLPSTISGADLNNSLAPTTSTATARNPETRNQSTTSNSDESLFSGAPPVENDQELLPQPFTAPSGDLDPFPTTATYKPCWATAWGSRRPESSRSSPQRRKHSSGSKQPARDRRSSLRKQPLSKNYDPGGRAECSSPDLPSSKSKRSHNLTEKKYRTRLNGYFETLLSAVPKRAGRGEVEGPGGEPEKKISKGEVLVLAMEYIRELERDQGELEAQRRALASDMEHLKDVSASMENDVILKSITGD